MFRTTIFYLLSLSIFGESVLNHRQERQGAGATEQTLSAGLTYERRAQENHVFHVVHVDPKLFRLELVKAHNSVFGRETVHSIALRKGALVGINAGYFEIGGHQDGRPSGTLVAGKKIFSVATGIRSLLLLGNQNVQVNRAAMTTKLAMGPVIFTPDAINRFAGSQHIVLYNSMWGSHSLTRFDRKEILIAANFTVLKFVEHGDNEIPKDGWIASFPPTYKLPSIKPGQKVIIETVLASEDKLKSVHWSHVESVVSGIPIVVRDGAVVANLEKTGSQDFTALPHARTAIGIRADGSVVMVVVEHSYAQPLRKVTLGQVNDILRKKNYSKLRLALMTLPQVRTIVEDHFSKGSGQIGLTLAELGNLMVSLGCRDAINLDGGGSSTLFFNGDTVNKATGDEDEGMGERIYRPVSDAIVVTKIP